MRFLRILLVIVVALLLGVSIYFLIFGGKSDKTSTSNTPASVPAGLAGAANSDATVTFTNDGQINGNEQHREIKITVSRNARTLTIIQGYQGTVVSTQSFANNQNAFASFLSAINNAGFATEKAKPTVTNIAGQCPLGSRYIYSSTAIQDIPNELWTTSCSQKIGTFGGNVSLNNQLFQLQIPNYSNLVSQVKIK